MFFNEDLSLFFLDLMEQNDQNGYWLFLVMYLSIYFGLGIEVGIRDGSLGKIRVGVRFYGI